MPLPPDHNERVQFAFDMYFKSVVHDLRQNVPAKLFHYTSAAGMAGILLSGRLWVNNAEHLNDVTELRYAMAVLRVTAERARATEREEKLKPLHDKLVASLNKPDFSNYCILSLVADGDDDELWRLYGDHGRGFSICVEPEMTQAWPPGWYLTNCIYNEEALTRLCRASIALLRTVYKRTLQDDDATSPDSYVKLYMDRMKFFAPVFKINAWQHEKEWRLVRMVDRSAQRQRPDGRYYLEAPEKSIGKLAISEAMIGPECSIESAKEVQTAALTGGYDTHGFQVSRWATRGRNVEIARAMEEVVANHPVF